MQSSAVVTLRALVMLLCLVLVPLAAIFGSALPQAFDSLIQGRGLPNFVRDAHKADDARIRGGDAPIFSAPGEPGTPGEAAASPCALDGTGSLWAPGASVTGQAPPQELNPLPADGQAQAARFDTPAGARGAVVTPLSGAAPARDPRVENEGFQQIERRLRELGATYYLLETWGNAGQTYRFHCKVSVAGHPNQTRHFDGTDNEPLRAMRKVLEQVEQYRAGTLP